MSISATSSSGSSWGMGSVQRKPPELTKDQLTQLDQQLKSAGKDTSNLDKVISNFDKLDTSKDGKLSMDELKTGAAQAGIQMPKGGGHHHHAPKKADNDGGDDSSSSVSSNSWGPPPGLLTDSSSATSSTGASSSSKFDSNTFMLSMLEKFAGSNPSSAQSQAAASSVNVAA